MTAGEIVLPEGDDAGAAFADAPEPPPHVPGGAGGGDSAAELPSRRTRPVAAVVRAGSSRTASVSRVEARAASRIQTGRAVRVALVVGALSVVPPERAAVRARAVRFGPAGLEPAGLGAQRPSARPRARAAVSAGGGSGSGRRRSTARRADQR